MTTPYEFGSGFQVGNQFLSDQGEIGYWELQWTGVSPSSQTVTAGGSYPFYAITWDKMVSSSPKTILMANANTEFIFPKSALYAISVHINCHSASSTVAGIILDAEIIKADGSPSVFLNGTNANTTAAYTGAKMNFNSYFPATAGDKVRVIMYCQGEDVVLEPYNVGTVTEDIQRHTFVQIVEIIDPLPSLQSISL